MTLKSFSMASTVRYKSRDIVITFFALIYVSNRCVVFTNGSLTHNVTTNSTYDVTTSSNNDVTTNADVQKEDVNIAIFVPFNRTCEYNCAVVMASVKLAIEKIEKLGILDLNHVKINPSAYDTMWPEDRSVEVKALRLIFSTCNPAKKIHAFIGPITDVTVNNIVWYSADENVAVITPGAYSVNFGLNKTEYPQYRTLVRIGPTINFLFNVLRWLLVDYFKFRKLKFLSEKHSQFDGDMCMRLNSGFDYLLNKYKNDLKEFTFDFDNHLITKKFDPEELLLTEVGTKFASKTQSSLSFNRQGCMSNFIIIIFFMCHTGTFIGYAV